MAPSATHEESRSSQKSDKKHKREKSEHKKRPREEDEPAAADSTPRKSKKAKSEAKSKHAKSEEYVVDSDSSGEAVAAPAAAPVSPTTPITPSATSTKKDKTKKKSSSSKEKRSKDENGESKKEHKESKKEPKKSKKHKKQREEEQEQEQEEEEAEHVASTRQVAEADAMEVDIPDLSIRTKDRQTKIQMTVAKVPDDPQFPFFKQTISMYVPIFPSGFDKPVTRAAEQHLEPLVNHYSTTIKAVLLRYSNVSLSDQPTRSGPSIPTTDTTPTLLLSRDEYGVGFGWLTFDAFIFKPTRGKWMEGTLQLQSEGYIGVLCWNKFNASIEAKRLPPTWKWVDLDKHPDGSSNHSDAGGDIRSGSEKPDGEDADDANVVEQMHTTGYWVDENGSKISGKLRFRIKNFDVGLAGDHGYLSIEGTFLDEDTERALWEEEREEKKRRRAELNPTGHLRPQTRRLPEFSVTKFGKDEEEELEDAQTRVVYQRSRPVTPDS